MWNAIISGIFLLVGTGLAFYGTYLGHKTQKEIAEMQINEKLISENKIAWANESRKLLAKFIRHCFELNHTIDTMNLIQEQIALSRDSSLPIEERRKLLQITEKDREDLKRGMDDITNTLQTLAELRLYIFDDQDGDSKDVLDKTLEIEGFIQRKQKIPINQLNELTDIAREYFKSQWIELTA